MNGEVIRVMRILYSWMIRPETIYGFQPSRVPLARKVSCFHFRSPYITGAKQYRAQKIPIAWGIVSPSKPPASEAESVCSMPSPVYLSIFPSILELTLYTKAAGPSSGRFPKIRRYLFEDGWISLIALYPVRQP